MEHGVSQEVAQIYATIIEELGESFSWHLFLAQVAYMRNKPVHIEELSLPIGVTGACFAFRDMDVVVVRKGLDPLRSLATRLHECAHLVLGHVVTLPFAYADVLHDPDIPGALYRDRTTAYDTPHEAAAETLATLLLTSIERNVQERRTMPMQAAKDLWDRST